MSASNSNAPMQGDQWFRSTEQRLRIMERHTHPGVEASPEANFLSKARLVGGGRKASTANGIYWDDSFDLYGGISSRVNGGNHVSISYPSPGFTIPVHGNSTITSVTEHADGVIPLTAGQVLYYDLDLDGSPSTGFHILDHEGGVYTQVPQSWVMICAYNSLITADDRWQWGDGTLQGYWQDLASFANGWVNYPGVWGDARVRRDMNVVRLTGRVRNGTPGLLVCTLQFNFRPLYTQQFALGGNGGVYKAEVLSSGGLYFESAASSTYMDLNGIQFYVG